MERERIIVGQSSPPRGVPPVRLPVGVVLWMDPVPALTVVVKVTLSFGADAVAEGGAVRAVIAEQQEPLSLCRTEPGADGKEELVYATDLVPFKPEVDVLLAGYAFGGAAPSLFAAGDRDAPPATRIAARIAIEDWSRSFQAVAAGIVERIPLRPVYLRDAADPGAPTAPVGPIATDAILSPRDLHDVGFDFAAYNAAPAPQRAPAVLSDSRIRLSGLSPRGPEREVILPGLSPRVFAELVDLGERLEVEVWCDTVRIDTGRERCVMIYRGSVPIPTAEARRVSRLLVALDDDDRPRATEDLVRELPRGHFFFALTRDDLAPGAEPVPERSPLLELARYQALAYGAAPDPAIPLEELAAISAELAAGREPRAEVLRRRGMTEERWTLEERAWNEAILRAHGGAGRALAKEYSALLAAARKRLPRNEEA